MFKEINYGIYQQQYLTYFMRRKHCFYKLVNLFNNFYQSFGKHNQNIYFFRNFKIMPIQIICLNKLSLIFKILSNIKITVCNKWLINSISKCLWSLIPHFGHINLQWICNKLVFNRISKFGNLEFIA